MALQEIALHYVTPALVGTMLLLRYHAERCCYGGGGALRLRDAKRAAAAGDCGGDGDGGSSNRYAKAVAPLLATAFTTLLTTTFKLLHCVDVGTGATATTVVFRAAGVTCDQWWRVPLFAVAGALLLPVAAALAARASPAVARWCAARMPWRRAAWARAVAAKLRAPFADGCWHWAAVLALQRLAVIAVCVRSLARSLAPDVLIAFSYFYLLTHSLVHSSSTRVPLTSLLVVCQPLGTRSWARR